MNKETWDGMVAEVARAKGFKDSLIAYLAAQPSEATAGALLADLKGTNDEDAAALEAAGTANPV
jgi:hypothetical protein